MDTTTVLVYAVLGITLFYIATIYNTLVSFRNRYKNAFAQIEVQLKRRYELIPNLVETAKAYLTHERETLEAVTQARNSAAQGLTDAASNPGSADNIGKLAQADNMLTNALGRFQVVMEDYPDLKADQTMMQLSEELTTTENRVAFARQAFNDEVLMYNTYKQSFPQVILAGFFGHAHDAPLLEFEDSAEIQAAPKVSF